MGNNLSNEQAFNTFVQTVRKLNKTPSTWTSKQKSLMISAIKYSNDVFKSSVPIVSKLKNYCQYDDLEAIILIKYFDQTPSIENLKTSVVENPDIPDELQ